MKRLNLLIIAALFSGLFSLAATAAPAVAEPVDHGAAVLVCVAQLNADLSVLDNDTANANFDACIQAAVDLAIQNGTVDNPTINTGILGVAEDGGVNTGILGTAIGDGSTNTGILGFAGGADDPGPTSTIVVDANT